MAFGHCVTAGMDSGDLFLHQWDKFVFCDCKNNENSFFTKLFFLAILFKVNVAGFAFYAFLLKLNLFLFLVKVYKVESWYRLALKKQLQKKVYKNKK